MGVDQKNSITSCVLVATQRKQRTLASSCFIEGQGLFTGENVSLRIFPSPVDSGISFKRVDLPGNVVIPATLSYVQEAVRCTQIGMQDIKVQTIEHLLAALKGLQIDNASIEINGSEVPILDGSSREFVERLKQSGISEQDAPAKALKVTEPVYLSTGEISMVAIPSDQFKVSYTLHYPKSKLLQSQFYTTAISEEKFETEIAPCRTFALYEEIAPLIEKGYIKGGGLDSAVIIKEEVIINPEGVRFPDEMVRHKVLDVVGDMSLMGMDLLAHIIAIRSGHASNVQLARKLVNTIKMES